MAMEQHRVVLDVGGVPVGVTASDEYLRFVVDRVGDEESESAPLFNVIMTRDTPETPERPPDQNLEMVDAWFSDSAFWMRFGSSVTRVSANEIAIGGVIDNPTDYKSIDLMVQFGLAAAVVAPDRIMVHGAVVARDESALLVIGGSGAGKSTAAIAAMAHGWDLLTDDLAVAQPGAGTVRGVARRPRLPAGLAARHGITGRVERGGRRRVVLPSTTLSLGSRNLVGMVMVGHGEAGRLERLEPGDLHAIDSALAVPAFTPVIRRHLAPVAALVSIPAFRLLHAADESLRIERAAQLLDDAMSIACDDWCSKSAS